MDKLMSNRNIITLSQWQDSNRKTTDQLQAVKDRDARDRECRSRALKRHQRSLKPFPVRFVLGLWDVALAFVAGTK